MTIFESLMVSLFCMAGVFIVLLSLCFIIKLFSFVLGSISKKKIPDPVPQPMHLEQPAPSVRDGVSSGNLKLMGVDEPTAAMIMAIVSDESGIPLSELCFKSIKLLP